MTVYSDKMSVVGSIKSKAGSKDSVHPADFTGEETLLIMRLVVLSRKKQKLVFQIQGYLWFRLKPP
jgi:hypothetical protein